MTKKEKKTRLEFVLSEINLIIGDVNDLRLIGPCKNSALDNAIIRLKEAEMWIQEHGKLCDVVLSTKFVESLNIIDK